MADMGYGLSREMVMRMAYLIAEKSHRKHPFTGESAGRSWFESFKKRHPRLTIRTPQPLSYSRALCANPDTISDFFGKLGSLYGKLNITVISLLLYFRWQTKSRKLITRIIIYYRIDTRKYHESDGLVLHECHRHECNTSLSDE